MWWTSHPTALPAAEVEPVEVAVMAKTTNVWFHRLLASYAQGVKASEQCSGSWVGLVCRCQGLGTTRTSTGSAGWHPLPRQGLLEGAKGTSCYPACGTGVQSATLRRRRSAGTVCSGLAPANMKKRLAEQRAACLPPEPAPCCGVEGAPLQQRSLFMLRQALLTCSLLLGTVPVLCCNPASCFEWPWCSEHPQFPPVSAA